MIIKKKLYEEVQGYQAKIDYLEKMIQGYTDGRMFNNPINPQIKNNVSYDIVLRVQDRIQAISRYDTNIPELKLPSIKLEALFYDYGSLAFFHKNKLLVSTYAKTGELNGLGDLTEVEPIDFAGKSYSEHRTVVYTDEFVKKPIIIINDYSGVYTENGIIPRSSVNYVSIADQASVYRKMKNALYLTAKKAVAICESDTQRSSAERVLADWYTNDMPIGSVVGSMNNVFKVVNLDTSFDPEPFMKCIDCYDKLRTNFNGIKTKSPYEKKERLIQSENENAELLTEYYLYDGLINRRVGIEQLKKYGLTTDAAYCKIHDVHKELYPNEQETATVIADNGGENG